MSKSTIQVQPIQAPRGRRLRRGLLVGLTSLAGLFALAYGGVSWYMVGQAVAAERNVAMITPASVGLDYEDVVFTPRGAGLKLRGWHVPAGSGVVGTLVLVHGLDSNRARGSETYLAFVRDLRNAGFNVLLFDLRAHGESEGTFLSAGVFEAQDVLGALDFVTGVKGERWERVGVLGFSFGAATALLAAEDEPRLRAIVADSSWSNVSDLFDEEVAGRTPLSVTAASLLRPGMEAVAQLRYGFRLSQSRPARSIAALDYPVLLVHAGGDTRVPAEHSRRLKTAARDPGTVLWLVPTDQHSNSYDIQHDEYLRRVTEYFGARFAAARESATSLP